MSPKEQHEFIRELCDNVRDSLLKRQYPEDWDGHELRVLIAERFEQSAQMSLIKREPQRKRARDYRNEVLVKALL